MFLDSLPGINACFNAAAALCLCAGAFFIKNGKVLQHRLSMAAALCFSMLFLAGYLYYHAHIGSQKFTGVGAIRYIYFGILIPHTILAAVMLPMIFVTFRRALASDFQGHRRLARWTLPVWLFVSVTGVIIYLMLYQVSWS